MTALNWHMTHSELLIHSDTLVCVSDEGECLPAFTTTKVYPVPHIKSVITGTGIQRVTTEWFTQVCSSMALKDVEMLDTFTTRNLQNIYDKLLKEGASGTATTYQFGWSSKEKKFQGFAYRSTNDFVSERLEMGTGMKPPIDNPERFFGADSDWPLSKLLDVQQQEDRSRPLSERVGIGGDKLQFYAQIHPETGNFISELSQIGRFNHYDLDWSMILSNLPANSNQLISKLLRNNYEKDSAMKIADSH